jgi:hypothetical protein
MQQEKSLTGSAESTSMVQQGLLLKYGGWLHADNFRQDKNTTKNKVKRQMGNN